jgi:hypothetical protein
VNQTTFDTLTKGSGARYQPYTGTAQYYELMGISVSIGSGLDRIRVIVLDATGQPAFNAWVRHMFGTDMERFAYVGDPVQFNLGVGSHYSEPADPPDRIIVENDGKTDMVLVGNANIIGFQHTDWLMTFRLTGTPPPVDPPEPTPTTLEEKAVQIAKSVPWMPVFDGAALWKFAKANGFEDAQTDEIEFAWMGATFIVQVFNKAIVYCQKGLTNEVWFVKK